MGIESSYELGHEREGRFDKARTKQLFLQYAATRDADTREQLVVAHLNLVRFLASRFAGRGEPLDDLIQVGMVGLLKAIDRFDPERGIEFTTYVTPTVVGEIKRHFRDKGWAIRVPRRLQELNAAMHRGLDALTADLGRSPNVAEMAASLHASEEEIIEAQELGHAYAPLSLDAIASASGEGRTLGESLGYDDPDMAKVADQDLLDRALTCLDRRERVIVHLRYFERVTQTDIARRLRMSQMHVSRLQQRALGKMKGLLQEESSPERANQ